MERHQLRGRRDGPLCVHDIDCSGVVVVVAAARRELREVFEQARCQLSRLLDALLGWQRGEDGLDLAAEVAREDDVSVRIVERCGLRAERDLREVALELLGDEVLVDTLDQRV